MSNRLLLTELEPGEAADADVLAGPGDDLLHHFLHGPGLVFDKGLAQQTELGWVALSAGRQIFLTLDDARALAVESSMIAVVSPEVERGAVKAKSAYNAATARVTPTPDSRVQRWNSPDAASTAVQAKPFRGQVSSGRLANARPKLSIYSSSVMVSAESA